MIPNITDYNMKKSKKLISIQKIDISNYVIVTKQFSEVDGTELPSQVQGVTISEIDESILNMQLEIDTLNAFKKDLQLAI